MTKKKLPLTEKRNPVSADIDQQSTHDIVKIINGEDILVAPAVARQSRQIADAVDMIVERFQQGGRLFYVGAGTSGRLGVLDASECPPTFGVCRSLVQGIIAGGRSALVRSIEGAEDSSQDGAQAVIQKKINKIDMVVGIAACGATPFVRGALKEAKALGAGTAFITCAPESVGFIPADVIINPVVGPEIITGSTRMKAGTATKLVLNTLTTAAMIKTGKVYGNMMVDLNACNKKLHDRSQRIVMELTGLTRPKAIQLLSQAKGRVKAAIVMHFREVTFNQAQQILKEHNQLLRDAIKGL